MTSADTMQSQGESVSQLSSREREHYTEMSAAELAALPIAIAALPIAIAGLAAIAPAAGIIYGSSISIRGLNATYSRRRTGRRVVSNMQNINGKENSLRTCILTMLNEYISARDYHPPFVRKEKWRDKLAQAKELKKFVLSASSDTSISKECETVISKLENIGSRKSALLRGLKLVLNKWEQKEFLDDKEVVWGGIYEGKCDSRIELTDL